MSSEITFDCGGFEDFEELLKRYSENVSSDKALDAVEEGAKEFVNDLLRLPKPRSQITKAGYTHIVSTFALVIAVRLYLKYSFNQLCYCDFVVLGV